MVVINAAVISVQKPFVVAAWILQLPWSVLNENYKTQTCQETYNIAVSDNDALVDLGPYLNAWPCIIAIQSKWL